MTLKVLHAPNPLDTSFLKDHDPSVSFLLVAHSRVAGLPALSRLCMDKGIHTLAGVTVETELRGARHEVVLMPRSPDGITDLVLSSLRRDTTEMNTLYSECRKLGVSMLIDDSLAEQCRRIPENVFIGVDPSEVDLAALVERYGKERLIHTQGSGITTGTLDPSSISDLNTTTLSVVDSHLAWCSWDVGMKYGSLDEIRSVASDSIKERFPTSIRHQKRLASELTTLTDDEFRVRTISQAHWISATSRSLNIEIGYGRGSAPASLISHLLGITSLDPVETQLFPYRFYSPAHTPDVDIDVSAAHRTQLLTTLRKSKPTAIPVMPIVSDNGEAVQYRRHPSAVTVLSDKCALLMALDGTVDLTVSDCEALGAIVTDLLSSRVLDTLSTLRERIPTPTEDDLSHAYSLLGAGLSQGVPHLHTKRARTVLEAVQPTSLVEVADVLALIRPGVDRQLARYLETRAKHSTRPILFQEDIYRLLGVVDTDAVLADAIVDTVAGKRSDIPLSTLVADLPDHPSKDEIVAQLNCVDGYVFSFPHALSYAKLAIEFAAYKAADPVQYLQTLNPILPIKERSLLWHDIAAQLGVKCVSPAWNSSPATTTIDDDSLLCGLDLIVADPVLRDAVVDQRSFVPYASDADMMRRLSLRVDSHKTLSILGGAPSEMAPLGC